MILASLDLSFTSTGLSIIDTDKKYIFTKPIRIGCNDKSFIGMQDSITKIVSEIEFYIKKHNVEKLVIEEPFPGTLFSAGLYGLDSVVFQHFKNIIIHTFHPTVLRKIHGHKYTKKDSLALAKNIISDLRVSYNYINEDTINIKTKKDMFENKLTRDKHYAITHDESESFIYAVVALIRLEEQEFFKYKELLHIETQHVCDWNIGYATT